MIDGNKLNIFIIPDKTENEFRSPRSFSPEISFPKGLRPPSTMVANKKLLGANLLNPIMEQADFRHAALIIQACYRAVLSRKLFGNKENISKNGKRILNNTALVSPLSKEAGKGNEDSVSQAKNIFIKQVIRVELFLILKIAFLFPSQSPCFGVFLFPIVVKYVSLNALNNSQTNVILNHPPLSISCFKSILHANVFICCQGDPLDTNFDIPLYF